MSHRLHNKNFFQLNLYQAMIRNILHNNRCNIFVQKQGKAHSKQSFSTTSSKIDLSIKQYLREICSSNFHPTTHQRNDIKVDKNYGYIQSNPIQKRNNENDYVIESMELDKNLNEYIIKWKGDGVISRYNADFIQRLLEYENVSLSSSVTKNSANAKVKRKLWSNMTEERVRSNLSLSFDSLAINPEETIQTILRLLYQYGIALITNTPTEDEGRGISALASSISGGAIQTNPSVNYFPYYNSCKDDKILLPNGTDGPMRTLYGSIWSTSSNTQDSGTSVADSAYTNDALPLHTDMTYMMLPPGLQLFCMASPAEQGGESTYGDGFSMAEFLRQRYPEVFQLLSNTPRRYRCVDEDTGWNLEGVGPIIELDSFSKREIVAIRHNDLDRLPDFLLDEKKHKGLKEAHDVWNEVVNNQTFRLVMALEKGDLMIVANQRCLHGRYGFTSSSGSSRVVMGCYVSQEELNSRLRWEGYDLVI